MVCDIRQYCSVIWDGRCLKGENMNIQTRLNDNKRRDLAKSLPLKQPFVLLIDPSSLCNLRCTWCPSGYDSLMSEYGRKNGVMSYELFEKIVSDSSEFGGKINVLRMYKEGEPLVNPRFADMVALAKKSGVFNKIETTTNGVLLGKETNRKLIDAGIDQINISVNGVSDEQIFKHTGRHIDFKTYCENIIDLCKISKDCVIYVKSIKDVLSDEEQQRFMDIFGEWADRIFLERLSPAWPDFDICQSGYIFEKIGNYGQPAEDRIACPYIFYVMVVNSDGTCDTCVGDWKHHQLTGDVKTESLKNIWLGDALKKIQLAHLENKRELYEMCKVCEVIRYGCYDNLDNGRKVIAERINKGQYN